MFLKKLLIRRADRGDKTKTTKTEMATKDRKRGIFRKQTDAAVPEIDHVLTMTMSGDEEDVSVSSTVLNLNTAEGMDHSEVLTFTKEQIRDNELNHMRQLNEKRRELDEFKASQAWVLAVKESERAQAQAAFEKKLHIKEREIVILKECFEMVLNEKENEIVTLKEEVVETKGQLSDVSNVLMQVQHELWSTKHTSWRW
jgi:hypothetical protein